MSTEALSIFGQAIVAVNRAIDEVFPGLTIDHMVETGEFEQALYMIWVASRLYFFDEYLPKRREQLIEELLRVNPIFQAKANGTFTREEVIALVKALVDPISKGLSSLRQSQIPIRGSIFEYIAKYPLEVLFHQKSTKAGDQIQVIRTPKKRQKENIDLSIVVGEATVIGLSVKGNVRERLRESIQRARNALDKGYFSHVWHMILTSGDDADKRSLNSVLTETLYHGHRVYTWTPLCPAQRILYPTGGQLLPFSQLPRDVANVLVI
ncbi:MAG: hypothetical protein ACE5OR_17735 [bacterium]